MFYSPRSSLSSSGKELPSVYVTPDDCDHEHEKSPSIPVPKLNAGTELEMSEAEWTNDVDDAGVGGVGGDTDAAEDDDDDEATKSANILSDDEDDEATISVIFVGDETTTSDFEMNSTPLMHNVKSMLKTQVSFDALPDLLDISRLNSRIKRIKMASNNVVDGASASTSNVPSSSS